MVLSGKESHAKMLICLKITSSVVLVLKYQTYNIKSLDFGNGRYVLYFFYVYFFLFYPAGFIRCNHAMQASSTVEAPRFEWRDTNTRYDRHREESEMTLPCTSSPDLSLQKGFLLRTRSRSCASSPAIFLLQKGILARQRSRAIVKAPSTSSPLSCRRAR